MREESWFLGQREGGRDWGSVCPSGPYAQVGKLKKNSPVIFFYMGWGGGVIIVFSLRSFFCWKVLFMYGWVSDFVCLIVSLVCHYIIIMMFILKTGAPTEYPTPTVRRPLPVGRDLQGVVRRLEGGQVASSSGRFLCLSSVDFLLSFFSFVETILPTSLWAGQSKQVKCAKKMVGKFTQHDVALPV